MREMLEGGELDVLTGDYLAELTMLILYRTRLKNPDAGYATTFVRQLDDCLGLAWEKGVRIVANAGGLNPAGCATAVRDLAQRLGLSIKVAHVEGDDVLPRLGELREAGVPLANLDTGAPLVADPLSANAYLGGWGIAAALDAGADVVVTGRVTGGNSVASSSGAPSSAAALVPRLREFTATWLPRTKYSWKASLKYPGAFTAYRRSTLVSLSQNNSSCSGSA